MGVHEDPKRPSRTHDEPGGLSVTPVPVGLGSQEETASRSRGTVKSQGSQEKAARGRGKDDPG